jgi:basic membrane protein A and related proteins
VKGKTMLLLLGVAALVAMIVGTTASAQHSATFKAAFVTDTNGLNDKGFNHLGNLGRIKAQKQLKIGTKVFTSTSESDYLPNAVAAAQTYGAGAVVMNGFLLADATNTAAKQFPRVKWAITDFSRNDLADKPANAYGLTFRSEQSGFLVGYLAAEVVKARVGWAGPLKGKKLVIGAVGGKKIPSVDNWIAGYRAGARAVDKKFKVLIDYSGDFVNSIAPKCKELALKHISQGSQVEFAVAGGCGLGTLQGAKSAKVWGIGVDADQHYLGPHILTSGTKRVDTAVYTFFKLAKAGKLGAGHNLVFNLKNKGQDVGVISSKVPKNLVAKMNTQRPKIISGKIKVPSKL